MLKKISDRIYYMEHSDETDRPALGLIIGNNYCMVVDSGNSPKHASEFQGEIAALKVSPVKYLALTHYHWDHVLGLSNWDVVSIAHKASEKDIAKYRDMKYDDASLEEAKSNGIYSDFAIDRIKTEIEDLNNLNIRDVDVFYEGNMKIDLGGVICELYHIESPHTDDTTMIYVPSEKTMFLGDCVYCKTKDGYPYYDEQKLFSMIDSIEEHEAEYYLCSHETLCPRDEIADFWKKLRYSNEATKKCSNLQEAKVEYQILSQEESTSEIEFFLKCFGVRE